MYKTKYHHADLSASSFLITGGAGFIGSNLVEYLLKYGAAKVRVLDNFSTGFHQNIAEFKKNPAFELMEGDIRDFETCESAVKDIDYVSHQAALGSVPRSINDPITTNAVNVSGFLNMLYAVKNAGSVKRFVYAASSSTYGDSKELPKIENRIGKPLSPYAVTKLVNELYADVFAKTYGLETIGLRYFNVFGPKQSPTGEYAAVIPRFIQAAQTDTPANINGDGSQTRDFTFIENVVQANIKAMFLDHNNLNGSHIYNIAVGERISLITLWNTISSLLNKNITPKYGQSRKGDIHDSLADISKATTELDYKPLFTAYEGLKTMIGG